MSAVTNIRLNKMQLKLADTDDPVAEKVSWDPLKPGGANFKTHVFEVTPTHMAVRHSAGGLAFALVFAGFGSVFVLVGSSLLLRGEFGGLVFLIVGSIFAAAGVFLLRRDEPLTFDKRAGFYYRGKAYRHQSLPRNAQGAMSAIHAIQLLEERIRSSSSSGGSSTYTSYEMNLVFADGGRINVLDHGKVDDVLEAAKQLAGFLDVPIWQASY